MYYIGIDLGGTNIACGLVSVSGEIAAVIYEQPREKKRWRG